MTKSFVAGIDLHSNNSYLGIADPTGTPVYEKRLPNELPRILAALEPYRDRLDCVIVESTYNWYWLVDGLIDHGYRVRLANPSAMRPYSGSKNVDDRRSAFFLIEMEQFGRLPTGFIYPKAQRPIRYLLRRRMLLVQQRTTHILSFQSMVSRQTGSSIDVDTVKKLKEEDVGKLIKEEALVLAGRASLAIIRSLTQQIRKMEWAALKQMRLRPEYEKLLTVPGIGKPYQRICLKIKSIQ